MHCPKRLKHVIEKIRQGFNSKLKPKLTDDGTSGTYEMRNIQKQKIAIFKPIDEEPFAPNNPRGYPGPFGSQFRLGILSGEACIREVAAYLLDHGHFSGIPPTTFVEVVHPSLKFLPFTGLEVSSKDYLEIMSSLITPQNLNGDDKNNEEKIQKTPDSMASTATKNGDSAIHQSQESIPVRLAQEQQLGLKIGSLQQYVESEGPVENFSPDLFSVDEVHKIAIIDLRLCNLDRNECNILVQTRTNKKSGKRVKKLIPIDHGLCLPDQLAICSFDLCWLSWDQATKPFSKRSLKYIESINIYKDINLLEQSLKFRPICLRNMRITTTLLQRATAEGLTLAQIGEILCKPDDDESMPSLLEKLIDKARLIADMMWQMQSKIKDTNLRTIDRLGTLNNSNNKEGEKDSPFQKRNRINSTAGCTEPMNQLSLNSIEQQPSKSCFFDNIKFSLGAQLGAQNDDELTSGKRLRGMSGVDDNNIIQLQKNTSQMIESHLTKQISSKWGGNDMIKQSSSLSPTKGFESCKDEEGKNQNSSSDLGQERIGEDQDSQDEEEEEDKSKNSDNELFFDCVEDHKGIEILNMKDHFNEHQNVKPIRRTASFSNIQIQEVSESEEEDNSLQCKKVNQMQSPDKAIPSKFMKMKTKQFDKYRNGMGLGLLRGNTRNAKIYFEQGSVRDTAHDEEFFHCFEQYLDEAIKKKKQKEQGGTVDYTHETFNE